MLSNVFCKAEELKCSCLHYEELTLAKIVRLEQKLELVEARIEKGENMKPSLPCPDAWIHFQDSCYLFPSGEFRFEDAEFLCIQYGSHLVHIETEAENVFLKNYMSNFKDSDYWTGLVRGNSGKWIWHGSEKEASYINWSNISPNNYGGKQDCVYQQLSYNFQWNDETCSKTYKAICERKR